MLKRLKKAFTIVELVIVIAVIAILAAVLIPTFVNIVNKANESADIQAVQQMNTVLKTDAAINGQPGNLKEAKEVLAEAGYKEDLTPNLSGHEFYWNKEYNVVMLIKVENNSWQLIYPTEDEDAKTAYTVYIGECYNLDTSTTLYQDKLLTAAKAGGTIKIEPYTDEENSDITKSAAEVFEEIIELSRGIGETFEGATIELSADLDLDGTTIDPMYDFKGTFDGKNYTISNFNIKPVHGTNGNGYQYFQGTEASDASNANPNILKDKIAYGIFGALTEGGTIKNLNVAYNDNAAPQEPGSQYTYFGGIVGVLDGGTISNCTVRGNIIQYNRVGGVVGTALAGTVENCTVTASITSNNVSDSSYKMNSYNSYSYAGGIIAYCGNRNKAPLDEVYVKNCTVGGDDSNNLMTISANNYSVGAVAGWLTEGSNLTVEDVTIKNVKLTSAAYQGAVVGRVASVTLTLKSVKLDGSISYGEGEGNTKSVDNVTISSGNISSDTDKKSVTYGDNNSLILVFAIVNGNVVVE